MNPRRHQIIARAFRRAFGQYGRFNFDKPRLIKITTRLHHDAMTQPQIVLHSRTTQSNTRCVKRVFSESESSSSKNGGGLDGFNIVSDSHNTSICPLANSAFSLPAGRARTAPRTCTQYSLRTLSAISKCAR